RKEQYLYTRELMVNQQIRSWDINHIQPRFPEDLYLVIGSTGVKSSTREQVKHVAELISNSNEHASYIDDIGTITMAGLEAMQNGDFVEVGRLMNQNQILLEKLQVSSTELRRLIRAALPTSLGTKLSGAGGGGCMIALTHHPEQTASAIESAGGTSFITSISKDGVRLESFENILGF
ncbi:MAG: mevalonate kinase, partial [archaeon]|nr:mevalonate kinase [archaeon]